VTPERQTVGGLDVLRQGPVDGFPLVFHCGTPNAPAEFPLFADAAAHIPGARVRVYDDEGHVSLIQQLARILDDLVSR
jgi:hypothetical protein